MSDLAIRIVVVAIGLLVIALRVWLRPRPGARRPPASVDMTGVVEPPALVLFTTTSCGTCEGARDVVRSVCGPDGFVEVSWEKNADALATAGIDEVPLTVAVRRTGEVAVVLRGTPTARAVRVAKWRAR